MKKGKYRHSFFPNGLTAPKTIILLYLTGWNLIGYSSNTAVNVDDLVFTNSTGTQTTWAQTWQQSKMAAYFAYYDSWDDETFEYAAPTAFGMDMDTLAKPMGYWSRAYQAGNLTIPSVGGSLSGVSYNWSDLMFRDTNNAVKNITDAGSGGENWISESIYKYESDTWKISGIHYTNFEPWKGYFIYSNQDNVTLLRRNTG